MSRAHFDIRQLDSVDRASLPEDGGSDYNRLIFSRSPYLLQHATNPVDWYPWGDEAFARAREEDKPVFLSIGYSTCHWCHVMADESFADPTVAATLRRGYVAVKVDREERPDIDNLYMNACQLMTGSGGWPLTLVLTPDKQPFFAATYIPRESRQGMYGLLDLLERITDLWREKRGDLVNSSDQLTAALRQLESPAEKAANIGEEELRQALAGYRKNFDARSGGFGGAPKFPAPHNLSLLFRLGRRFAAAEATDMATATLDRIRAGGVYDQIGFGLHRYAVDNDWQVPHFEKMLYDQALFMLAALDAWQLTGDPAYAAMVSDTAAYLLRDLQAPDGGFFAGEDADSEGAEGTFYLWTPDEVNAVLGSELGELFCKANGITPEGNFEGRSIPHRAVPLDDLAAAEGLSETTLEERLETGRKQLLGARNERIRPHRDDKILTAWNGLIIAALARCGAALERPEWLAAAEQAAAFLLSNLVDDNGRLLRSWRREPAAIPGFAEDYAGLSWGLLELYQANFAPRHLEACRHWVAESLRLFGTAEGELWDVGSDAEQVIGRGRSLVDGAVPAAGSILAGTLLRLADTTGDETLRERAVALTGYRLARAESQPTAFAQLLMAVDYRLGPAQQLVICAADADEPIQAWLGEVRRRFLPNLVCLVRTPETEAITAMTDLFEGRTTDTGITAYLCSDRTCREPASRLTDLATQLDRL